MGVENDSLISELGFWTCDQNFPILAHFPWLDQGLRQAVQFFQNLALQESAKGIFHFAEIDFTLPAFLPPFASSIGSSLALLSSL